MVIRNNNDFHLIYKAGLPGIAKNGKQPERRLIESLPD